MVDIALPDDWLDPDEKDKLKRLFEVSTDAEFETALNKIALAALDEYKEMLLGQGMPTRAQEIRQHRLRHLIRRYFETRIPSETQVSDMFQLTDSQARALIQDVTTRFRYEVETAIHATLTSLVAEATWYEDEGQYRVIIQSDNALDALKSILDERAPNLDQIRKVTGSARNYYIKVDSYRVLCEHFGIPFTDPN